MRSQIVYSLHITISILCRDDKKTSARPWIGNYKLPCGVCHEKNSRGGKYEKDKRVFEESGEEKKGIGEGYCGDRSGEREASGSSA